jgi:hypothetical protein
MRAACRTFLDEIATGERHLIQSNWSGPFESSFYRALGELRALVGLHVAAVSVMHGIDVEAELASLLPEPPEK